MVRAPRFASLEALIRVDMLAQRYHCRPSALLNIADPYLAYYVDEAAAIASVSRENRDVPTAETAAPPQPPQLMQTEFGGLLTGSFRREGVA